MAAVPATARGSPVHLSQRLRHILAAKRTINLSESFARRHMDKSNVIYAGCGASTSGEQGSEIYLTNSGDWGGIMVSQDAGDTWSMTGFPSCPL